MAIDPSIALQVGQGVPQVQQPMQMASQFMALKNAQQQNQLGGIQLQQGQMALQDQQKLSQLMQSGKYNLGDPNSIKQMAADAGQQGVSPQSVLALTQKSIDQQAKIAETGMNIAKAANYGGDAEKARIGLVNDQASKAAVIAQTINDPQQAQAALANLDAQYGSAVQKGNPQGYVPLAQKYGAWDPASRQTLIANATTMNQAHEAAFGTNTETLTGMVNTKQPLILGSAPVVTPLTTNPLSDVAKAAQDLKDGRIDQATFNQVKAKETHIAPAVNVNVASGANQDTSQALPPGQEAMAQAIAKGLQAPLTPSSRNPYANQINGRAAALAGAGGLVGTAGVSAQTGGQKSFAPGGTNGQTLINLDTAIHHFDALGQAVGALGNGDTQGLNKVGNYLSSQFGDPKVTNFNTVKTLAADEFAKVAAGSQMGESDRQNMQNLFSSANSPQQLTQAIQHAQQLMGGKVQGLNQAYQQIYPGHNIGERVSPETNQVLQGMGIKFGQGNQPQAPAQNAAPSGVTPGMVPKRSDGSVLPDGHYHGFVVQGGKVSSVG